MRKLLPIVLILLLFQIYAPHSFAFDDDDGGMLDMLKYSNTFTDPHVGQKQITDEEFNKKIEEIKAKQNKSKKNKAAKGESIKVDDEGDYIDETAESTIILNIPLTLVNGDGTVINAGYYKALGQKNEIETFINLYQGHDLIAKLPMVETDYDFDEQEVNFIKIIPYNEERVKVIFGSIDFNAYTFLDIY